MCTTSGASGASGGHGQKGGHGGASSSGSSGGTTPSTDTEGLERSMAASNALGIKLASLTSQNESNKAMNQAAMDAFKGLPR